MHVLVYMRSFLRLQLLAFWSVDPYWTSPEPFESGIVRVTLLRNGKPLEEPPILKRQAFFTFPSKKEWSPSDYANITMSSNQTSIFPILQEPSYSTIFLYLYVTPSKNESPGANKTLNGTVTFHLFNGNTEQAQKALAEEGTNPLANPVWTYNFR